MTQTVFRAGAAATDITPSPGTLVNGDFFPHRAAHIHDRLHARALVLEQGDVRLAIVVVDICVIPRRMIDEIKTIITRQTGIPASHILVSCTHTHAAGSVGDIFLTPPDEAYAALLPGLVAQAVTLAIGQLRPAAMAHGTVQVPQHAVCRRYYMKEGYVPENPVSGGADAVKTNPFGAEHMIDRRVAEADTGLSFLAVKGAGGEWISVLANYSLHYAGDWENGTISPDYFGVFSRHLTQLLEAGNGFQAIMSNGTSGDVNIWDFLQPQRYPTAHYAKSDIIGKDLAEAVYSALPQLEWNAAPVLAAAHDNVLLKVRKPQPAEVTAARELMAATDYTALSFNMDALRRIYAREQVLLADMPDELLCPVQALRIGDGRIGALPGEFFAETGLRLKQAMPHYFTIGLANANVGYVPPLAEMERGGYETWRCRNSLLEAAAEKKITNRLLQLLQSIQ